MVTINGAVYRRIGTEEVADEVPYLLSWGADNTGLKTSIEKVGQVSPLVIWPHDGRLKLLCGVRRRQVLQLLDIRQYHTLVLPDGIEPKDALVMAIEDNLGHRSFNDAEIVLAIDALNRTFPTPDILSYMPRLGLPPTQEFLDRYKALADLGPAGLNALAEGYLDPETGELLTAMNTGDHDIALNLLDRLRPGRNKRREILTQLTEIAHREGCSVSDVIRTGEIQEFMQMEKLNRVQKEKKVRDYLRARRMPNLTRLEAERAGLLKALKLPANVRLTPPPNFEGLDFHLDVDFQDLKALEQFKAVIERLLKDPNLTSLLELG